MPERAVMRREKMMDASRKVRRGVLVFIVVVIIVIVIIFVITLLIVFVFVLVVILVVVVVSGGTRFASVIAYSMPRTTRNRFTQWTKDTSRRIRFNTISQDDICET